ncbi:MAG: hypothetical protein P8188_17330 [Gemmatimonadota bacterium]|jgi:YbbR domain-containing protein
MGAPSFIPGFITHNASLKLLALVGAFFLWAIVPGTPEGTETLTDIPVRIQVGDPEWLVAGAPEPSRVTIRVSGPTPEIIRLAREGTSVRAEIQEVTSPDTLIQLRRDWVVLAGRPGVVVEELVPAAVQVRFEASAEEALPILVRTRGRLPDGVSLAFPLGTTPAVARVSGPARIVRELEGLPTVPLDLSALDESGQVNLPLDTTGLEAALVTPHTVSVGIRVAPTAQRRVTSVPLRVQGSPDFEPLLDPTEVEVVVRGAPARLEAAGLASLRAVVDGDLLSGMAPGASRWVPVGVTGVPELLGARPVPDSVLVIRPVGGGEPLP